MAMLWLTLVAIAVACEGRPGLQIQDLDEEFYSEVRDLLNKHATHRVSTVVSVTRGDTAPLSQACCGRLRPVTKCV
jgi:hypothetical protein